MIVLQKRDIYVVDHQIQSTIHTNYNNATKGHMISMKDNVINGESKYYFALVKYHLIF